MTTLSVSLDRAGRIPLSAQIYGSIGSAIESGQLAAGARLPSWSDLDAQLGVSRGTVRAAYERLIDEQFAIGLGAAGTRVAARPLPATTKWAPDAPPLPDLFYDFSMAPLAF
jgi:GntR family transcriptional regulator/MocR family aminotransferase